METRISFFFKKTEQHEITIEQNKRETKLKLRKIFKEGKVFTFLEKDTNLDATITSRKGLIGPADRIWTLSKPTKPLDK